MSIRVKPLLIGLVKILIASLSVGLTAIGVLGGNRAHPGMYIGAEKRDDYRP